VKEVFFYDRELSIFSVVLPRFYDFHIDTFMYKGSAAIIGYCGLLTTSECVLDIAFEFKRQFACDVVIHTDSTQYKQLQISILSITSDHANV
jgi:hypothetical protein